MLLHRRTESRHDRSSLGSTNVAEARASGQSVTEYAVAEICSGRYADGETEAMAAGHLHAELTWPDLALWTVLDDPWMLHDLGERDAVLRVVSQELRRTMSTASF